MKKIPLSNGRALALVDDEDYEELSKYRWWLDTNGYAMRWVRKPDGKNMRIAMHRQVLGLGKGDRREGDHIDRNPLNNCRGNLRICGAAQNLWNRGLSSNNTSGFKGVYWHKRDQKWIARINVCGRRVTLGYFQTAELAHDAYCKAANELHGEFANTGIAA